MTETTRLLQENLGLDEEDAVLVVGLYERFGESWLDYSDTWSDRERIACLRAFRKQRVQLQGQKG